jgi:CheY-like chemotaxis protein
MPNSGARVLIVDDDAASRRLLDVCLRLLDCQMVMAADG